MGEVPAMFRSAALILAAGGSRRLGEPKQLVTIGKETLLERSIQTVSDAGLSTVVVVLGAHAALIQNTVSLSRTEVVVNERWEDGMASSIKAGIAQILSLESLATPIHCVVVMACDQPSVTVDHIQQLVVSSHAQDRIVASAYGRRRGVPAAFPRAYLPLLQSLSGDSGAREFLRGSDVLTIPLPNGGFDIDTQDDLRRIEAWHN